MPTYQYQCRDCGHGFEQFQKFSDDPLTVCPECGGTIARVIQNVGVVFKGSGWYINDSRKPGDSSGSSEKTAPEKAAKDAPKKDTKPADAPAKSEPAKAAAPSTAD